METGIQKCPKCQGQGVKRYKGWSTRFILWNFIRLKAGYPLQELDYSMFLLKIRCPLCGGDGIFDWIKKSTNGHIKRSFASLEGNMDLYQAKAVRNWPLPSSTHNIHFVSDCKMYNHLDKLIECSQKHYIGIKLNKSVLSMGVRHLEKLCNQMDQFRYIVINLPESEITEERFKEEFVSQGLSKFMPDKFAHPGPDDFPV